MLSQFVPVSIPARDFCRHRHRYCHDQCGKSANYLYISSSCHPSTHPSLALKRWKLLVSLSRLLHTPAFGLKATDRPPCSICDIRSIYEMKCLVRDLPVTSLHFHRICFCHGRKSHHVKANHVLHLVHGTWYIQLSSTALHLTPFQIS